MKKSGISLIVLVITIIVIIILAGAVILSLSANNPILQSSEAKFKADIATIQQEVNLTILSKAASLVGNVNIDNEDGPISTYSKAANASYLTKLSVVNGRVVINSTTTSANEISWASQVDVKTGFYQDVTAPVILLNEGNIVTVQVGTTFTDPGALITDNVDTNVQNKLVVTGSVNTAVTGTYIVKYNAKDSNDNLATEVSRNVIVCPSVQSFAYTGSYQTWASTFTGKALLQVYGACGGYDSISPGATGGYSYGEYNLTLGQTVYIYAGGSGLSAVVNSGGGFNGGGNSGPVGSSGGGGGATDIRIGGLTLANRILVAGGGGGAGNQQTLVPLSGAGKGGGLLGLDGSLSPLSGGTQSAGGTSSNGNGSLGIGGNHTGDGGGGGGGYYGGGAGVGDSGGGGGSGFIGVGITNGVTMNFNWSTNGYVKISRLP
jgi:Tfp pilus assembly protein PilE